MDNNLTIFSRKFKSGNRTYFFDVKKTKNNDIYLVITESKVKFNNLLGKKEHLKHKIFIYQESLEEFIDQFNRVVEFLNTLE